MINQEFKSAVGIRVRTIEAEAAGGLVEIDLRNLKPTSDGTYLVPSKDLQAAGKWAFTLDIAQAKKEGKPVSPEDEKQSDSFLLILHELLNKLPAVTKSISDVKNSRPHPIQMGLEKALAEEVADMSRGILQQNPAMMEKLQEVVEQYLTANILGDGEEEEA